MVVLAASICTRGGKPVVLRQFLEMPRSRIEGLLTSFPKLIDTGSQHTTVETDEVRYVYQPLEELFMILITNRQSNILQDIDTLHLFARVVTDVCRSADEREILRNSFELLSAFDEIISLGFRENVNLIQVRSILEMESHEEKIQEIIAKNKEQEAKEELKRRAKQLEMQRREAAKRGQMGGQFGAGMAGGYSPIPRAQFEPPPTSTPVEREPEVKPAARPFKSKGMQLGKKGKQADLLDALGGEMGGAASVADTTSPASTFSPPTVATPEPPARVAAAPPPESFLPSVPQESIHLTVREKISVEANRDGGLESLEVKGDLDLKITDPALAKIRLALKPGDNALIGTGDLQFKTHPNMDKKSWASDRVIALKDTSRAFPVNQALGVLRWRMTSKDETAVPLSINCWPSPAGDGTFDVNIEYELESDHLVLQNVVISIPLPAGAYPTVGDASGSHAVNPDGHTLDWTLETIDASSSTGSLEFSIAAQDASQFFPVQVEFVSRTTVCDVAVDTVTQAETGETIVFSHESILTTEDYVVA